MRSFTRLLRLLALCVTPAVWLLNGAAPSGVQAAPPAPLHIVAQTDGLRLTWSGAVTRSKAGAPELVDWPLVDVGGAQLPARLIPVRLNTAAPVAPHIEQLASERWQGKTATVEAFVPQATNGQVRPDLAQTHVQSLPLSPVVVLREGRLRGERIAVLAVSPVFTQAGSMRAATSLDVTIPGATLLSEDAAHLLGTSAPFLTTAPVPDPRTASPALRIRVTQAGIQRITGTQLAAAGLSLTTLNPANIHLRHAGAEVALEERGTSDNHLDPADELRFYAPSPGDRWNAADTYWLTVEETPGLRMTQSPARPAPTSPSSMALERGVWHHNTVYDSTLPGPDGDHWFATDLRTGPNADPAMLNVPLTPTLALNTGTTVLTVTGSAYTGGNHNLTVTLGTTSRTFTWRGTGDWAWSASFADNAASAKLTLNPGTTPDGIEPDSVSWERPVALDVGGKGAWFAPIPGVSSYQLTAVSAERTLYDVINVNQPAVVALPDGPNPSFDNSLSSHLYLLAGPGTVHIPEISASTPVNLATPMQADVVYIAPASLQNELAPLKALREAQGHSVAIVDVQAIYDAWSGGQVSPEAIRSFLRYAAATWSPAPAAVTLVGDGTSDPLNYTGTNNADLIPPYLAMVDPWQGEAACETCYAQLDGNNPLDDSLPDLALGRLPVKSAAELTALVGKIVQYETAPASGAWQSRIWYIADNYREANGDADGAGDFAAFADQSIALQPAGTDIQRMYYDPSPTSEGVPWREPNAVQAHQRTLAALNGGAAIVNYVGHSHWWQWAVTDVTSATGYLLGLYEADTLTNGTSLPVILEMTCLTSSFEHPAFSGTTIDERLLLNPTGGAAAIWGPTGLGVAHGHDSLQRGFYKALWNTRQSRNLSALPGRSTAAAPVGTLIAAGYLELFAHGACCQDALRTFALLGEPLTTLRVQTGRDIYLPIISSEGQ